KAIAKANRNTQEHYKRDLATRRVNAAPPVPKIWHGATDDAIWTSLSFIDGTTELRDGRIALADNNQLGWSISSLYRRLSPVMQGTQWQKIFRVPASVAADVAH
ncbi:hypothetical protein BGZ75_000670, partial [Mortierella antarctica]